MTSAQVVETSVTVTNSSFQNYTHPDDHTRQTIDTPGFKQTIYYEQMMGKMSKMGKIGKMGSCSRKFPNERRYAIVER